MAYISQVPSGSWKAVIRRTGNPTVSKTFRLKTNAEDWARKTEAEIVRGVYISKSHSEKTTIAKALERYLQEITPTKNHPHRNQKSGVKKFYASILANTV